MNARNRQLAVIGGGIAGLTAADVLSRQGLEVALVDKAPQLGGHAMQFSCKATTACVKCGACRVTETLQQVLRNPRVSIYSNTRIEQIIKEREFLLKLHSAEGAVGELTARCRADRNRVHRF